MLSFGYIAGKAESFNASSSADDSYDKLNKYH